MPGGRCGVDYPQVTVATSKATALTLRRMECVHPGNQWTATTRVTTQV